VGAVNAEELHAAQAARWRAADRLLPEPATPAADPVSVPDGAGWLRRDDPDPASMAATWSAARRYALTAHVAGADPAAALGALLDRWDADLGPAGDQDSAAEVLWPSRDTSPLLALTRRGFGPATVIAVRRTGGVSAPPTPGVEIRPLTEDDVDAAVAMHLGIVAYDAQFGAVGERSSTAARMREGLVESLEQAEPTVWVATAGDRPVGLCEVEPPDAARWIAGLCRGGPVGYLSAMYVDPTARGGGVGAALHAAADAALARAGAEITLLHHAAPNPLSTPFWYGQGYRPLWTSWQRRPAVHQPGYSSRTVGITNGT
jgi:GNAT superfamily N-acetyltransferase